MIAIFALIGSLRGWAKEMMVTFSVVLSIFVISILDALAPGIMGGFTKAGAFYLRAAVLVVLVFFGYQAPNFPKIGGARFARERLQDVLLGLFIGAFNGFLIAGTLWYFLDKEGYPFPQYFIAPVEGDSFTGSAFRLLPWLAPRWLRGNTLYVAVALAFVFVIVVFI